MKYLLLILLTFVHSMAHGEIIFDSGCPSDVVKGKLADITYRPGKPATVDYFDLVSMTIEISPNNTCTIRMTQDNVTGGMAFLTAVGKNIELKRNERTFKVSQ